MRSLSPSRRRSLSGLFGLSLMSIRAPISAALLLPQVAQAAPVSSPAAHTFENGLRRTVIVAGQEQARFSLDARMKHYGVPGVSVAIIDGCRIVDARGFGTSAGTIDPISSRTLFQAGSISKSITAVVALRLVEDGRLELDGEVRPFIEAWSNPGGGTAFTAPVTLRRLLNHTAGLNEIGGQGYDRGASLPTLAQILNGSHPAKNPPVRIVSEPDEQWAYSSGGYYLIQDIMESASGAPFPSFAEDLVLKPVGMLESTFAQPLDAVRTPQASSAAGPDGLPLPAGWRVNPELAAGGLWTTPTDLALFLITLVHDIRGESEHLLRRESVRQMLAPGLKNWGLGVELGNPAGPRRIAHTGHTVGFVSEYVMYPDTCQGAVVMTNGDEAGWLISEILRAIGDAYHWPEKRPSTVQEAVPLTGATARRFMGTYRLRDFPSEKFTIARKGDWGLYWAREGHLGRDLVAAASERVFSPDSGMTLVAINPSADQTMTLELWFGGGRNVAERTN